jgi:Fic family protein
MVAQARAKWRPIEDLPDDLRSLANPELASLGNVWREQKELLEDTEAIRSFNERLQRKWAIETGIIERVYSLDRGVTQLLIEQGIDANLIPQEATDRDPALVAQIIRDQKDAVEGLFAFVKGNRELTTSYIKELHAQLTRSQPTTTAADQFGRLHEIELIRGDYKRLPNNPSRPDGTVHEYCPPEQVAPQMERLLELHLEHERLSVPTEVEAAWFHHRFTQIHPFQDGNGRVVRTLASLIFIRAGWFPLVVTRDDRLAYIDALEDADGGDLQPLVDLFARLQKRAFVGALSEAGAILQRRQVDHVIDAARDVFERRQRALREEWERAREIAGVLIDDAHDRLEKIAARLRREIGAYNESYRFFADREPFDGDRDHYFRWQIIQAAKKLDYFANAAAGYRAWTRLVLSTDTQAEVLVSFHGIGHEFRGVLVASIVFFRREETEEGEREVANLVVASDEPFQINYLEDVAQTQDRFARWLDQGLVAALEVWRSGL